MPLVVYDQAPGALRQHLARSLIPDMNPSEHRTTATICWAARCWSWAASRTIKDYIAPATADTPLRRDFANATSPTCVPVNRMASKPSRPMPMAAAPFRS